MKTLYMIPNSPYQRNEAFFPLKVAGESDGILLIQSGVVMCNSIPDWLKSDMDKALASGVKVYACKEDLEARSLPHNFEVIDYNGIIDLLEHYERVV